MATEIAQKSGSQLGLRDGNLFRQACFIDGTWVKAGANGEIQVDDPATGDVIGTVPDLGAAETRAAIAAAQTALPGWRALTAKERSTVLRRWFDLVMANQDDLATLMTREQGKPLTESRGEVVYGASF